MATGALAIAVGRLIPSLTGGARWPFRLLGLGYGALAVIVLIVGVVRQAPMAKALRRSRQREGRAMRDRYIDWSAIDAAFPALVWILVVVLAAVILVENLLRSEPIAHVRHYEVGR